MKTRYLEKAFRADSLLRIEQADAIIEKYRAMGLRLTLRQLYYQFVAHEGLPNNERSYKGLGKLVSDARLAGLLDWDAIEDRGRVVDEPRHWDSVKSLVEVAVDQFKLPRWKGQDHYVELWVEKQALAGVLEPVAEREHIALMVNKGYSSQSAMHASALRFRRNGRGLDSCVLLYIGDHDPSGEDMVRDVRERLELFGVQNLLVHKVALTMEQIEEHQPPPNPAKLSDSRARAYIAKHGDESWEVDALDPETLVSLITDEVDKYLDRDLMQQVIDQEQQQTKRLRKLLNKESWT